MVLEMPVVLPGSRGQGKAARGRRLGGLGLQWTGESEELQLFRKLLLLMLICKKKYIYTGRACFWLPVTADLLPVALGLLVGPPHVLAVWWGHVGRGLGVRRGKWPRKTILH